MQALQPLQKDNISSLSEMEIKYNLANEPRALTPTKHKNTAPWEYLCKRNSELNWTEEKNAERSGGEHPQPEG